MKIKIINLLCYCILVFLFLACNNGENKISKFTASVVETGEKLSFRVPDSINPIATYITYYENDHGGSLYYLSSNNQILKYNMQSDSLCSMTVLEKKGDNGIGVCEGIKVLSDTLFIVNSIHQRSIYYVNKEGQVINKINFDSKKMITSPALMRQGLDCMYLNDSILIIPQEVLGMVLNMRKSELENYRNFISYNLNNKTYNKTGMSLPYIDDNNRCRNWLFSVAQNEDLYVISFNSFHDLFITNDFVNFDKKNAESVHFFGTPGEMSSKQDMKQVLSSMAKNCTYYNIIWDKYNGLYYRLYKIGQKVNKDDDLFDLNEFPDKLGVMVFNDKFEIIADDLLTPSRFNLNNYIVTPKGLYLAIGPNSIDYDVNNIKFELLKVTGDE